MPSEGAAVLIGAGIGEVDSALISGLRDKGYIVDAGAGAHTVGGAAAYRAAIRGGAGVAVIEASGAGVGQVELDTGESRAAAGGTGRRKVAAAELDRSIPGGIADHRRVFDGAVLNDYRAGDGLTAGAFAAEVDAHAAGDGLGRHKGDVLQVGTAGAIVAGGGDDLLFAALIVFVIKGALTGGGEGKLHVVQIGAGLVFAEGVEITALEGNRGAGGGGVGNVAGGACSHIDLQGAGEGLVAGALSGKVDGDGAGVVLGGDEGDILQGRTVGAIVFGGRSDLLFPALIVLIIEGAFAGGGEGKLHVIHGGAGLVFTVGVEVAVIKGDAFVFIHGVGDALAGLGDGDGHGAGEAGIFGVPAGELDGDRTGPVLGGHEREILQGGRVAVVELVGGGNLLLTALVILVVEGALAGGGEGELHIVQRGAGGGLIFAVGVKIAAAEGDRLVEAGGVLDVAGALADGDDDRTGKGVALGIVTGVGEGGLAGGVGVGQEGDLREIGLAGAAGIVIGGAGGDLLVVIPTVVVIAEQTL
ncbi:Uncharacterised protein [uncultured Flavonifractor sp.]|nr:Uncharacterised protein [Flavonifractor plautii]SCJ11450.1 Uncharacterised protein [uncultured Flavonifractor sp.]